MYEIIENNQAELMENIDLQEIYNQWIEYIDSSRATINTYNKCIRQFFIYMQENNITKPTRTDVMSYRDSLLHSKKPATVQTYIISLRQFFNYTEVNGYYPNIAKNIKGAKIDKGFKKDYLTKNQITNLVKSIDRSTTQGRRDYAILCLMLTTGIRTIEVVRAKCEDIKPVGNDVVLFVQGKGHTDRNEYVKLAPVVLDAINDYLKDIPKQEYLFVSLSNKNLYGQLTTRSVSRLVKEHLKDANYNSDRLTAHSLRHTAITQMLLNGATLEEAQQVARHKSINTTMIYSHALKRANNNSELRLAEAIL